MDPLPAERLSPHQIFVWLLAFGLIALTAAKPISGEEASPFDPETGYRIAHYRSPVSPEVPGGTRIWIEDLDKLVAEKRAVLLDVMPSDGAGPDPATGEWHMAKRRQHIPGSTWLPDTGKGRIEPAIENYFKASLARLTAGDTARPIIIYCQSDCWMGWNAVKRAASYGYTSLYWYPDGTDGWRDWDRPLTDATPEPMPPGASEPQDRP